MRVSIELVDHVDIRELLSQTKYATIPNAERTLEQCLSLSQYAWLGLADREPVCLWGLIPPTLLSEQAYLWLITTEKLDGNQFLFVRHSQRMVEEMLRHYKAIVGHTAVNDARAIRWLKWLGAEFTPCNGGHMSFVIRKPNG